MFRTGQSESLSAEEDFFECVRRGDMDAAADHLARGTVADVDSADAATGATALMVAAACGHCDVVRMLLSVGAAVDARDAVNGWTALMQAVFHSHRAVTLVLLERGGADPTVAAFNGCTALDLATLMEESDTEVLELVYNCHQLSP